MTEINGRDPNHIDNPTGHPASATVGTPSSSVPAGGPVPAPGMPREGQTYPETLRTATARWWKPVVAILGAVVVFLIANVGLLFGVGIYLAASNGGDFSMEMLEMSPLMYGVTLLSLVLLLPITWVIVRFIHGQSWGYTFSVLGGLRWTWLWRMIAVLLPVFVIYMIVFMSLTPDTGPRGADWLAYALIGALLMPFQAAAEEVFFRGYVLRGIGSWFAGERAGFAVGLLISSLLFMTAHFAADPWLNLYYFAFGATLAVAAKLTGGIEVPIAMHVVNNVVSGVIGAYTTDMAKAFDRSVGVGGPFMLVQIVFVALCAAALVWWLRRGDVAVRVARPVMA